MEAKDNKRYSNWDIITYALPEEFIVVLCEVFSRYAWIKHDMDRKEDGTIKEPHYHIIGTVKNQMTFSAILKHFERASESNTRAIPITRGYLCERYEYLTHKNDKDKFQYEQGNIFSNDKEFYERLTRDRDQIGTDENEEFLNDLLSEDFDKRRMALKYGRDFIRYFDRYMKFRAMCSSDMNGTFASKGRSETAQ